MPEIMDHAGMVISMDVKLQNDKPDITFKYNLTKNHIKQN